METYNVDYFIKKFEAIPKNKFVTRIFRSGFDSSKRCFMGHCLPDEAIDMLAYYGSDGNGVSAIPKECLNDPIFKESNAIVLLFHKHFGTSVPKAASHLMYQINNGDDPRYQQSTVKQRILAALYDIKKAQGDQMIVSEARERTVYVTVDASVRELQKKELSMQ